MCLNKIVELCAEQAKFVQPVRFGETAADPIGALQCTAPLRESPRAAGPFAPADRETPAASWGRRSPPLSRSVSRTNAECRERPPAHREPIHARHAATP